MDGPAIRMESRKGKSREVAELAAEAFDVLEALQFDIKEALSRLKALTAKQKKVQRRRK